MNEAINFIDKAVEVAKQSTCERAKCGSIIVKDNEIKKTLSYRSGFLDAQSVHQTHFDIIGEGYNSPANNLESQRRCKNNKDNYHKKVTDKTCCVHAEQRAIMDALAKNPSKLKDSSLYFIRLDENNNKQFAENHYCTICSKMALDTGIKEFILMHKEGITSYNTEEYNSISYNYK